MVLLYLIQFGINSPVCAHVCPASPTSAQTGPDFQGRQVPQQEAGQSQGVLLSTLPPSGAFTLCAFAIEEQCTAPPKLFQAVVSSSEGNSLQLQFHLP